MSIETDRDSFEPTKSFALHTYGSVYTWAADFDRGEIVAVVCVQGYCGGLTNASPDAQTRVFRSVDGGITWTDPGGDIPPNSFLIGLSTDGSVGVATFIAGPEPHSRTWLYPSGAEIEIPPGAEAHPVPVFEPRLGYLWRAEPGTYVDSTGRPVAGGFEPTLADSRVAAYTVYRLPSSSTLLGWQWSPGDPMRYWGLIDDSGVLQRVWSAGAEVDVSPRIVLSDRLLLGSVRLPAVRSAIDSDVEVALIDLETGVVSPLTDLSADMVGGNRHPILRGATVGSFVRVVNTGDCLNVRQQPDLDAPVLACYRDGVLLRDRGESQDLDGVTWLAVATPDGREGWASAEFLEK